ncbi:DUF2484 family protein [Rhodobacter sp. Har01]|uniref:DUF2484 family protein n=1 Tax=Rhodobacter sp. Har01 TaxID=2883999 RepID=UPI001D078A6E|nr:DUF2484 family protein [Rhodobacter sp. Har01]MCB6176553.1 DUF2484 family protein [Rhodobacter sp. Har01]
MTAPLALACLWLIAANGIAMLPSRDHHWRAAYVLIALGIPLLGWLTWKAGPLWALLFLAAGASLLRWPLVYLWRWARRRGEGPAE